MKEEEQIVKLAKRDLRRETAGNSMLLKLVSLIYPLVWKNQIYVGPGNWEIDNFDMSHEPTRKYVEENPNAIDKVNLSQNEAFVRVNAYWGSLASRRYDYKMKKEDGKWKVEKRELSGMS